MNYFEEAALRLKQVLKVSEDQEAAALLGLSKHAWMGRKKRGSFPEMELYAYAGKNPQLNIDVKYVLLGNTMPVDITNEEIKLIYHFRECADDLKSQVKAMLFEGFKLSDEYKRVNNPAVNETDTITLDLNGI